MLCREGWSVGRNLVYRVYREEGLALRSTRPRRHKMAVHRETRRQPLGPNESWSLDFVHDHLADGGKFRLLTVIDVFSREALAIKVGRRLRGEDVVGVLYASSENGVRRSICSPTTGQSLPSTWSTCGPITAAFVWTPLDLASPRTMPTSRRSMGRYAMNA